MIDESIDVVMVDEVTDSPLCMLRLECARLRVETVGENVCSASSHGWWVGIHVVFNPKSQQKHIGFAPDPRFYQRGSHDRLLWRWEMT